MDKEDKTMCAGKLEEINLPDLTVLEAVQLGMVQLTEQGYATLARARREIEAKFRVRARDREEDA
jgi:hypothetical protein